jgi:hypothetical protein
MKIGENAMQNSNAKTEGPKGWLKNGNPPRQDLTLFTSRTNLISAAERTVMT